MINTSKNPIRSIQFYFLTGVESVRVEGEDVVGRWRVHLPMIWAKGPKPGRVVEEFVNTEGDLRSIARFTGKYGPLGQTALEGQEFRVSAAKWLERQQWIREQWALLSGKGLAFPDGGELSFSNMGTSQHQVHPLDWVGFDYKRRCLVYRAATLRDYLTFDLFSLPFERLKLCAGEDCPHPYFLAPHLRQKYCSEPCAWKGLRASKLDWYYRKTGKRRKEQTAGSSNKKGEHRHGTRKTR